VGTMAMFEVSASVAFSVDTNGCAAPCGHNVKYPSGPGGTTVALNTKACAAVDTLHTLPRNVRRRLWRLGMRNRGVRAAQAWSNTDNCQPLKFFQMESHFRQTTARISSSMRSRTANCVLLRRRCRYSKGFQMASTELAIMSSGTIHFLTCETLTSTF
jgi:hypothetical protein